MERKNGDFVGNANVNINSRYLAGPRCPGVHCPVVLRDLRSWSSCGIRPGHTSALSGWRAGGWLVVNYRLQVCVNTAIIIFIFIFVKLGNSPDLRKSPMNE